MFIFLFGSIWLVQGTSIPLPSIFLVVFHHMELTIIVYVDVVASGGWNTIFEVSNSDGTIFVDVNASAMRFFDIFTAKYVLVHFSKISTTIFLY